MLPIKHQTASLAKHCGRALLLSTALVSMATNSATAKSSDTTIHFAKGAVSSTTTGKLASSEKEHWYRFQAEDGQYAVVNIAPLAGTPETANVGVLYMPNGTYDGSKGGIVYQDCLPGTGEYRLRVARNLMATHSKTAGYKVEVVILPKYASKSLCERS